MDLLLEAPPRSDATATPVREPTLDDEPQPQHVNIERVYEIVRGLGDPASHDELLRLAGWLSRIRRFQKDDPKAYEATCREIDRPRAGTAVCHANLTLYGLVSPTKQQRRRMHETVPGFSTLTAVEIAAAGRRGYRGSSAIRYALRLRVRSVSPPAPGASLAATRPREHRASTSKAGSTSGDDRPRPRLVRCPGVLHEDTKNNFFEPKPGTRQKYCTPKCENATRQARWRERQRVEREQERRETAEFAAFEQQTRQWLDLLGRIYDLLTTTLANQDLFERHPTGAWSRPLGDGRKWDGSTIHRFVPLGVS